MSIRRIKQRMQGEWRPRSICSTGAEEAAIVAAAAESGGAATFGGLAALEAAYPALYGAEAAAAAAGAGGGLSIPGFIADNAGSLALQGAGYGMKAVAGQDAADRRSRIAKAMGDYQMGAAKKSTDLVNQYADQSTPEARAAALAGAEAEARTGYEKTIGAAGAPDRPVAGKLSDQYTQASAASADAISRRNKALIENLSRMRAPGVAQGYEARRFGRAAGDVDALNSAAANVGRASSVDLSNVQESPWLNLGGDALAGAGQGLALRNALKGMRSGALG